MKFSAFVATAVLSVTASAAAVAGTEGARPILARNHEGRLDRRWCYPLCCCADSGCTGGAVCDATQAPPIYTSYCCNENLGNAPLATVLEKYMSGDCYVVPPPILPPPPPPARA